MGEVVLYALDDKFAHAHNTLQLGGRILEGCDLPYLIYGLTIRGIVLRGRREKDRGREIVTTPSL